MVTKPVQLSAGAAEALRGMHGMLGHRRGYATEVQPRLRPFLAVLTRHGLLISREQSEQVRGERRVYYRIYEVSDAGRAWLAADRAQADKEAL